MATGALLFLYAIILSAISGYKFAGEQFATYRFYVINLAVGFGIILHVLNYIAISGCFILLAKAWNVLYKVQIPRFIHGSRKFQNHHEI